MAKTTKFQLKVQEALKVVLGELCLVCNAKLEPGEKVYLKEDNTKLITMPKNGKPPGKAVICANCK